MNIFTRCERCTEESEIHQGRDTFGPNIKLPEGWSVIQGYLLCPTCAQAVASAIADCILMGKTK